MRSLIVDKRMMITHQRLSSRRRGSRVPNPQSSIVLGRILNEFVRQLLFALWNFEREQRIDKNKILVVGR
jgi:hypothetical protein